MDAALYAQAVEALSDLPTVEGGSVIVMATASVPPAMAVLSTGDVALWQERVRVGVFAESSVASQLGGAFSLLLPAGERCLRVEAVDASAEHHGRLALVDGRLNNIRPTAEPPWVVDLSFRAGPDAAAAAKRHVAYWAAVRAWLTGSAEVPSVRILP